MSILFTGICVSKVKSAIWPIFLPFAGCPKPCIFCSQEAQTGIQSSTSLETLLQVQWQDLQNLQASLGKPKVFELAFYGGTFTCLPQIDQNACMAFVKDLRQQAWIASVRCSTRPDACSPKQLAYLKKHDINHIELGVQSFNDTALHTAKRHYSGDIAKNACKAVLDAGFTLGIQLLPGMPGVDPECFLEDVDTALCLQAHTLRFYPCLVIKSTPLAKLWHDGAYTPWSEQTTITTLAKGLIASWRANVPVIRLSLAHEATLESAVLAGPRHPALGSMIMAEALILQAEASVYKKKLHVDGLYLPKYCRGFWKGHANSLLPRWEKLGIKKAYWYDKNYGMIIFSQSK